jgi:prevent-host-death family protein
MAYYIAMKIANIADFKDNLSSYLRIAESGEEIQICKRNVPVARLVPIEVASKNRTRLGVGRETVLKLDDAILDPIIPESAWEMLKA